MQIIAFSWADIFDRDLNAMVSSTYSGGVVGKGRTLSENYRIWRDPTMMNLLYTIVNLGGPATKKSTLFFNLIHSKNVLEELLNNIRNIKY